MNNSVKNIPARYWELSDIINDIEYNYGNDTNSMPDSIAKRYEKAKKEMEELKVPKGAEYSRFFDANYPALYDLWLKKDSDKPITGKELFSVVNALLDKIRKVDSSIASHIWSS